MLIQPLSGKMQNFAAENQQEYKTDILSRSKSQKKQNDIFSQAAYVVEFSDRMEKTVQGNELRDKIRDLGKSNSVTTSVEPELADFLNKTEVNLDEMERLAELAKSDKVTDADREAIQKEIGQVISRIKKDEPKMYKGINETLDSMARQVVEKWNGQDGSSQEETEALKKLQAYLNGEDDAMSMNDKIDNLLKVQGLDEQDKYKLNFYQKIMSLTNSLNDDLAKVYKTDVTVEGGADKALENIHAAQKKVKNLNRVLEFEENIADDRKARLEQAKQFAKTTQAMEQQFKENAQTYYTMHKEDGEALVNAKTEE